MMDRMVREAWVDALGSADKCAKFVEVLEALVPACQGPDRVSILAAIEGLRGYAAVMFPDAPHLPQTEHLH